MAAKSTTTRNAEANRRLDELLRSMLLKDLPRMRALVAEHRLREACAEAQCVAGDAEARAKEALASGLRDAGAWRLWILLIRAKSTRCCEKWFVIGPPNS